MTCGPNLPKLSAHTRESTESSPPSMPCSWRQLRSGNCQPRMAVKSAIPSASADSGPAIPSSDIDMATTTLVISGSSRSGVLYAPLSVTSRSRPPGLYIRASPDSDSYDYLARGVALFLVSDGFPYVMKGVPPADDRGDLSILDERGERHEDLLLRRARDGVRYGYPLRHQRCHRERREHVPPGCSHRPAGPPMRTSVPRGASTRRQAKTGRLPAM